MLDDDNIWYFRSNITNMEVLQKMQRIKPMGLSAPWANYYLYIWI